MRLAGSRRHVPVDQTYVVPGGVGPHLRKLRARALQGRAVVARQEPYDPPADADVERAEQGLGHGPGPRLRRRRAREPHGRHAAEDRARSSSGAGTAVTTASRIESGLTSSASAWYVTTSRWRIAS